MFQNDRAHQIDKSTDGQQIKVLVVNFPKITQAYLSKNYAFLYSVTLLYYDGIHEVDKINTCQLKSPFRENGQFHPNLDQNCDTSCLMISIVRTFLTHCSIMRQDRQTVVLIKFSQHIYFSGKRTIRAQFDPNLAKWHSRTHEAALCQNIFKFYTFPSQFSNILPFFARFLPLF